MKLLQRSLVARIIASLLAISGMALISVTLTMAMSNSSRGDAAAINVAGSLRMTVYQMMWALQRLEYAPDEASEEQLASLVASFDQRLNGTTLQLTIPADDSHESRTQLEKLQTYWQHTLRPALETPSSATALDLDTLETMIVAMVNDIEVLVTNLEQRSESKVRLLGMMQVLFLVLIAIVVAIALYDVRYNLVVPLRQLMVLAREAAQRNFKQRSQLRGSDELALLGHTFNRMSAELATSYAALEDTVSRKKQELERSNQALRVMHDASRSLYGGGNDLCSSAAPMLRELEKLLNIGPIRLSLNDPFDQRQMPVLETHSRTRPEYCRDQDCHACLIDPRPLELVAKNQSQCLLLPISVGDTLLGTLEVWYPQERLNDSTRRLLTMLADQLATAVYLQRRIEEQQHVTLINERTIIARELHDSLAQSLSYLKMQVARLERMQQKEATQEAQSAVFDELRTGLNSAYRQLRELLTTFRLKLEGPGLQFALRQTVEEFSQRMGVTVDLDYDVPPYLLNPNEEIHVLQIIREALANTHKHAQAHWAGVTVRFADARVLVRIEDDGIGLEDDSSPPMHYGLVIIRDRATTLNGELSIANRPTGGTGVKLVFTPLTARLIQQQPDSAASDSHLGTGTS
ncbi:MULTISPECIES: type IV pili methyl-accepting chemotaxis transducer N-terminal domain-containing protein [Halomonadaceae]|jgi:two-component system nitrate/nitrite sensor histidine kinase NarX|uniref:type IV pili methyl-accepting chemotaxis transducer N-terminal domain-containing protein n=1 Tax=Halomonadaceae TaxID=28256 RepID=UPI000784E4DA|nr:MULTISPECIES: type IV pili methyl-accepting chemotaxis transducer N-terminal domain-containing protein [Halomonas]MCC4288992.1 type IV pili methyl-accepting chemotaxis transducer N-terminal domain-containing protein [Halomonas meridiana]MCP1304985.1 type IV pili methyl-accepting chemotaxis transducer N-terminal domain-containing protein [Halomonas sp. R1t8]MCP1331189.1 type IV pili methyl-accepting chemotaxis transducer N-terminal domain-containing protein [Halomonas sp. R1t4]